MLTLRVIYKADGSESIWQTHNITARAGDKVNPPVVETLLFQEGGGAEIEIGGDIMVYVMNDAGKTIASYFLTSNKPVEGGSKE